MPFRRGFLPGRDRGAAADIADQDIDAAPPRFDIMRHRERRRRIGDVGDVERCVAAQLPAGRFEAVLTARGKRDMRAFGGERPRDRKADAPACAGDQRDTAFQLELHLPASSIHRTVMSR